MLGQRFLQAARRLVFGTPAASFPEAHVAWLGEQIKAYAVPQPYASVFTTGDNWTLETIEMRRAYRTALAEPAVKAPLLKKCFAVASLDVIVKPANPKDPRSKESAEWLDYSVSKSRGGGWPRLLLDILLHSLIDGYGVGEKCFETIDSGRWAGRWTLKSLKIKDTEGLRFMLDQYKSLVSVRSMMAGQGGQSFDPSDFVIFQHLPMFESPFGTSDLRGANRALQLIPAAIKLRQILLENFSGPFLKAITGDDGARRQLKKLLPEARARGFIILPADSELEVLNLATSAPDQFEAAIDDLRKEAATGISGAYLQMLANPDSAQGNSETHRGITETFEWYLAFALGGCLNEQLVPDLHDPHYGTAVERPTISIGGVDPNELNLIADRIKKAQDIGVTGISAEWAAEVLHVELSRRPGDVLAPMPAAPSGGMSLPFAQLPAAGGPSANTFPK